MFFGVNADSPSNIHVKIGKLIYERPNPNSLEDHAVPRPSYDHLDPHQKESDTGKDQTNAVISGLSLHHSQTNCELFRNQAKICPSKNIREPRRISVVLDINLFYHTFYFCQAFPLKLLSICFTHGKSGKF